MKGLDGTINSMDMCEQIPGVTEKQGRLACCSPWGHKELEMTERWNDNNSLPSLRQARKEFKKQHKKACISGKA